MSRRQDYRDGAHAVGVGTVVAGLAVVGLLLVALMWVFGFGFFARETAEFRGATGQRERTVADPGYRIAAYDRFFDLCAAVQAKEAAIANLQAEAATTTDAARAGQLASAITAQRNTRAELITTYNADAAKEGTRAQFQASSLPYTLDAAQEATTCAL